MLLVLRQPEENRWIEGGKEELLLNHLRKREERWCFWRKIQKTVRTLGTN